MRNIIFWRLWKNVYITIGVLAIYYYLCELVFEWSDLWNMLIIIPLYIYVLHFNPDTDSYIYKDNFSDITILKLKFRKWYRQWKKRK